MVQTGGEGVGPTSLIKTFLIIKNNQKSEKVNEKEIKKNGIIVLSCLIGTKHATLNDIKNQQN